MSVPPYTILSLALATVGIGLFVCDVRAYRRMRGTGASELDRAIARLTRWRLGSIVVGMALSIAAVKANMNGLPRLAILPLYWLIGLTIVLGFVASVIAGSREGRKRRAG